MEVRLNKHIADSGLYSRRKADELIAAGKVLVNGNRVETGTKINPAKDKITVNGKPLKLPDEKIYIAFHKPKDVVTTRRDQKGRKTIYDCLPEKLHSVDPAGRLDRDSTGLLLLSSDGDFIYRITHPKYHLEKSYNVTTDKPIAKKDLQTLLDGVMLYPENKKAQVHEIEHIENNRYQMVLITGYNRQIRRTLGLLGYDVKNLKRTGFGPIRLGSLAPGENRPLKHAEILSLTGGASKTPAKKRPE